MVWASMNRLQSYERASHSNIRGHLEEEDLRRAVTERPRVAIAASGMLASGVQQAMD